MSSCEGKDANVGTARRTLSQLQLPTRSPLASPVNREPSTSLCLLCASSKEQKGTAVRCRRWVRPLQRIGMVASTSAFPPRAGAGAAQEEGAGADIPEGLRPFCRPDVDGRVVALVHENQVRLSAICLGENGVGLAEVRIIIGIRRKARPSLVFSSTHTLFRPAEKRYLIP